MNRCYSMWILSFFVFLNLLFNTIQKEKQCANWAVEPTIRCERTQYFVFGESQVVIKYSVLMAIFSFYFFSDWPDDENIGFEILDGILYWTKGYVWALFLYEQFSYILLPTHIMLLMASSCVCWQTLYWNKSDMFGPL